MNNLPQKGNFLDKLLIPYMIIWTTVIIFVGVKWMVNILYLAMGVGSVVVAGLLYMISTITESDRITIFSYIGIVILIILAVLLVILGLSPTSGIIIQP